MTSRISSGCVDDALFEPGVCPWICAGASFPKAGGMVMKRRQPGARNRYFDGSIDGVYTESLSECL